jgi:hypothetical protein
VLGLLEKGQCILVIDILVIHLNRLVLPFSDILLHFHQIFAKFFP